MRILIPITLAAGLALALAWRASRSSGPRQSVAPQATLPAPAPAPHRPPPELARVPAAGAAEPAPEQHARGLEDGALAPAPDFSATYAGWSDERLAERLRLLELHVQNDQDKLFKDRFERGLYAVHPVDLEGGGAQTFDFLTLQPPPGEIGRGKLRLVDSPSGPGTRGEYLFATLPRAEYPDFYRKLDERDWLRARARSTERP